MSRIICVGQAVVDLVLVVARLPEHGGDLSASDHSFQVGGAFNAMSAARREGASVVYAGGHGTGPMAELVRRELQHEEIEVALAPRPSRDTGVSVAMIDPSGERTFVSGTGAEYDLGESELSDLRVDPDDIVLLSGYSMVAEPKGRLLLSWLTGLEPGTRVAFDPGPLAQQIASDDLEKILARTWLWTGNLSEARALVDEPGESAERLAALVSDRLPGGACVVVRDGPSGCVIAENGAVLRVDGFASRAIDTNGAGDAHTGVLLAGLLAGHPLLAAARRANAAASLAVERIGPAQSPTRGEIDSVLARSGPAVDFV